MQDFVAARTDPGTTGCGCGWGQEHRQAGDSPTSDELRPRLDLRMCFQWIPASSLSPCSPGEEGPRDRLWSVRSHRAARGAQVCALPHGFGFGAKVSSRTLLPTPPIRVSQPRALLRKKKAVCFNFKIPTLKYRKGERKHLLLYHKQ